LRSRFGKCTGIALIDSTALVVCGNKRSKRNRVFHGIARPAYYLKEELNEIREQDAEKAAEALMIDGITYAESSGIRMLQQFARTLCFHARGMFAYYDYAISTGPLEGTNNKIKTMKRQAYGFRDHEFLTLKILGIHETRYALAG
jgi:transposase